MSLFSISRTDMRVAQTGFPAFPIARIVCSRYSQIMRVHLVRDLFIFIVTKFFNIPIRHIVKERRNNVYRFRELVYVRY